MDKEGHEFEWDHGVHLKGAVLWFDSERHNVTSFVSSGRVDESWRHLRALCTERTRSLLRVSHKPFQALVAPYGHPLSLGPLELTLLPSGFMPGAAQLLVRSEEGSTLYANHVSLERHPLAEPPQFATANNLVLRVAYGRPDFAFPAWHEVLDRIVDRAQGCISADETPVFLCSPLGKAQEVIRCLTEAGLNVTVHRSIARFNKAYRALGFDPGVARIFKGDPRVGEVLVYPEKLRFSPAIKRLRHARLFWVSGLSRAPDALARVKVDEGIPLAGHLDHAGLMHFVEISKASRIFTVGGWAEEFAEHLRKKGLDATALQKDAQLSLF